MIIHGVDHDYDDYDDYDDHDDPKHEAVLEKEDESGHLEQSFTRPWYLGLLVIVIISFVITVTNTVINNETIAVINTVTIYFTNTVIPQAIINSFTTFIILDINCFDVITITIVIIYKLTIPSAVYEKDF